jgi:hypothetical protein
MPARVDETRKGRRGAEITKIEKAEEVQKSRKGLLILGQNCDFRYYK